MEKLAKWLVGIGLATIVGLAIWFQTRPAPEPVVDAASETGTGAGTEIATDATTGTGTEISTAPPAAETGAEPAPTPEVESAPKQEPEAEPAPAKPPEFDVVRVSPEGQTVLAGRAAPGQIVEVLLDGEVIGSGEASATGEFAAVLDLEPSSEARVLTMRTSLEGAGETTVALAPSDAEAAEDAAAKAAAVKAAAAEQAAAEAVAAEAAKAAAEAAAISAAKQAAAEIAAAKAEAAKAEAAAAAAKAASGQTEPSVSGTDAAATESAAAEVAAEVAVDEAATAEAAAAEAESVETAAAEAAKAAANEAVAAKQATDAAIASAEPEVSRYVVSAPVIILPPEGAEQAPILLKPEPEGVTLLQPAEVDASAGIVLDRITYSDQGDLLATGRSRPGARVRVYANAKLVDEIRDDNNGNWEVTIASDIAASTVLLRFDEIDSTGKVLSRLEAPFEYSPLVSAQELRERKIVVQKGDYLWKFAEQHYGAGWRYSVIFSANSDLIRDPDLIYPGQIFSVPELVNQQ
jgi:nucleoid-associated protein YgaU